MKMRNGFVSNSSTSSFVLLTTEENHQNILKTFTDENQNTINDFMYPIKLGNIELRIFQMVKDMEGNTMPERPDRDLFDEYKDKLRESKIIYSENISG